MLKRMGFLKDQAGIISRFLNEGKHWEEHLERSRSFINQAFTGTNIDSVAVLGSGWLLDVPLQEMAERFDRIYLVDIFHPPQVHKKVSSMWQVELVEADLSGGAIEISWQLQQKKARFKDHRSLDFLSLTPPLQHIQPDAYISVNLLSQLDTLLCDFLMKHGFFKHKSADRFRNQIQSFHLEWITTKPGCLITDTQEISTTRNGIQSSKALLHTDLPSGIRSDNWIWEFDNTGSYKRGTRTHMEVQAIEWR
jgi:hypothetical protein